MEEATVENKEKARMDDVSADAAAVEDPRADVVDQQRDVLTAERDGYKAERDELKELLLRRQAEFDNFRKRTEKERSEYLQYAGMEIVREILPILDDFDRARKWKAAVPEYVKGGGDDLHPHVRDAEESRARSLSKRRGRHFDPHLHQAVERVETKDADGWHDRSANSSAAITSRANCCGPPW